jgi:4,5-DOPA dioxygenase extradiol
MSSLMPVAFVSDFGPMPAFEDDDYTKSLEILGRDLPRPDGILAMSGHWDTGSGPIEATASLSPEIIYDYYGFPREFYDKKYPCPGDPLLAQEAVNLLLGANIKAQVNPNRGLDHGAWVSLSRIYPKADIPVVQLSVPAGQNPEKIFQMGKALSNLRKRNILILSCGALIHNLGRVHFEGKNDPPDSWAAEFDQWLEPKIDAADIDKLKIYRSAAPHAALAAPTSEHFDPLFFALGAGLGGKIKRRFHLIRYGNGLFLIFTMGP